MRSAPSAHRIAGKGARVLVQTPVFRKLRVLATDPGIAVRFESAASNEVTVSIPWEPLRPGPVGEYVEVADEDMDGARLYEPVDLDRPELLAQDGVPASAGDPQFRQQMAYAVAMRTIRNFERALSRSLHWCQPGDGAYVKRLRLLPHGIREANAFYDHERNAAVFGRFRSSSEAPLPGVAVFVGMSPDVIAHTVTHAVLAGLGLWATEPSLELASFHEGFSDLLVTLQRFFPSGALREQLAAVRGHLEQSSTLGAIGYEFGQALGMRGALRDALRTGAADGSSQPRRPDPTAYANATEAHERGSALHFAVFEAFRKLYEWRVSDLRRIASKGTGELPNGEPYPDLVARFEREACDTAQRLLDLCIRALDYLPPPEFTFGDYLRALVTVDLEVNPQDERRHRAALLDAFRSYAILPDHVATLSLESLLWPTPDETGPIALVARFVRRLSCEHDSWNLPRDREELWRALQATAGELRKSLTPPKGERRSLGPVDLHKPFDVRIAPMERMRASGQLSFSWQIRIIQAQKPGKGSEPSSTGTTLIVDASTGVVRYQIDAARPAKEKRSAAAAVPERWPDETLRIPAHPPPERRLRVFAFDPSLGARLETAEINEVTIGVPWERDADGADVLEAGPVGEYVEVVDRDAASGCFYDPVDLDQTEIIAANGLAPSESNPQFHQQMVYAVAMRTIRTFEVALGRLALWSPRRVRGPGGEVTADEYVQRLRIYPHALREANAYYSPDKKALLLGYFPAPSAELTRAARLTVFTCLSQDVVVHEITHALLDGMHRRFNEPSNPDVLAFHEAFADLVALFHHFSLADVLRHQIATTRGDLASQNRLGELAQQFGQAIGKRGALRNAIGEVDEQGRWRPLDPDPEAYGTVMEPHDRGAILVATVFDAFLTLYKARVADLLRIATEGTGVLPQGQVHPDLVNRLAAEAARTARHVLDMCIRALDYCPPVDLTFGDYLRAVVTADFEYDPEDAEHRRVAFVEAFRRRGIVPEDVRTLSVDGLLWRPTSAAPDEDQDVVLDVVKIWRSDIRCWDLSRDRRALYELMAERRVSLHAHVEHQLRKGSTILGGIDPDRKFEVHSIRPSMRSDWQGTPRFQWVIELTQRIPEYVDPAGAAPGKRPDYYFRGGCTLLVDAETGAVRYSIRKRLDAERRERQREYLLDEGNRNLAATYFGSIAAEGREPFAMLHRL